MQNCKGDRTKLDDFEIEIGLESYHYTTEVIIYGYKDDPNIDGILDPDYVKKIYDTIRVFKSSYGDYVYGIALKLDKTSGSISSPTEKQLDELAKFKLQFTEYKGFDDIVYKYYVGTYCKFYDDLGGIDFYGTYTFLEKKYCQKS